MTCQEFAVSCCRSMVKRSNKALYGFDDRTKQMILLEVLRGLCLVQTLGWKCEAVNVVLDA